MLIHAGLMQVQKMQSRNQISEFYPLQQLFVERKHGRLPHIERGNTDA